MGGPDFEAGDDAGEDQDLSGLDPEIETEEWDADWAVEQGGQIVGKTGAVNQDELSGKLSAIVFLSVRLIASGNSILSSV